MKQKKFRRYDALVITRNCQEVWRSFIARGDQKAMNIAVNKVAVKLDGRLSMLLATKDGRLVYSELLVS